MRILILGVMACMVSCGVREKEVYKEYPAYHYYFDEADRIESGNPDERCYYLSDTSEIACIRKVKPPIVEGYNVS